MTGIAHSSGRTKTPRRIAPSRITARFSLVSALPEEQEPDGATSDDDRVLLLRRRGPNGPVAEAEAGDDLVAARGVLERRQVLVEGRLRRVLLALLVEDEARDAERGRGPAEHL